MISDTVMRAMIATMNVRKGREVMGMSGNDMKETERIG